MKESSWKPVVARDANNKFDGTSNPDQGEKSDMALTLKPNQFPRQHGHDSLTEEEAQLT